MKQKECQESLCPTVEEGGVVMFGKFSLARILLAIVWLGFVISAGVHEAEGVSGVI